MPDAESSVIVPLREPFIDARGKIQNLIDFSFNSAAVITCVKGAVRGNHYHKTDYHYCWLQSGRMRYYQRPVGSREKPKSWLIEAGQLYYTPPMHEHAMHFLEESVFFVFSRNNREMANYDADTVHFPSMIVEKDA